MHFVYFEQTFTRFLRVGSLFDYPLSVGFFFFFFGIEMDRLVQAPKFYMFAHDLL
jgi:hypothetical protein